MNSTFLFVFFFLGRWGVGVALCKAQPRSRTGSYMFPFLIGKMSTLFIVHEVLSFIFLFVSSLYFFLCVGFVSFNMCLCEPDSISNFLSNGKRKKKKNENEDDACNSCSTSIFHCKSNHPKLNNRKTRRKKKEQESNGKWKKKKVPTKKKKRFRFKSKQMNNEPSKQKKRNYLLVLTAYQLEMDTNMNITIKNITKTI